MLITAGWLFSDAAQRFADRPALQDGISYSELDRVVGQVAGGFAALGVGAGARVGVLSHNRPELVAVWLGLERAGLVRVVLHSHLEIGVHVELPRRTEATALLFDVRFAELVESELGRLPDVRVLVGVGEGCPEWALPYEKLLALATPGFNAVEVEEDAAVCIQPTSGTTGSPKPWVVSRRGWMTLVVHNLIHLSGMEPLGDDEVNLHVHALQWAWGAQTLLPYMLVGARAIVLDDSTFDPAAIARAIGDSRATGLLLPGPMLAPLLDAIEASSDFSHSLRRLVTLFCPPELLERTTRLLGPVWCHGYGSTEQGAPVSRLLATESPSRPASVGRRASPLIEVAVLGEAGQRLPPARVGEIVVRGGPVAIGMSRRSLGRRSPRPAGFAQATSDHSTSGVSSRTSIGPTMRSRRARASSIRTTSRPRCFTTRRSRAAARSALGSRAHRRSSRPSC